MGTSAGATACASQHRLARAICVDKRGRPHAALWVLVFQQLRMHPVQGCPNGPQLLLPLHQGFPSAFVKSVHHVLHSKKNVAVNFSKKEAG
jgi:hypothetical protein